MKGNRMANYFSMSVATFFLFSLLSLNDAFAESENSNPGKGKLIAGLALMAGGATVAIIGGTQVNVFEDNGGGGGAALIAGIATFGGGVVLTILGLHDRSKAKEEKTSENSLSDQKVLMKEHPLESQFFLGPAKRGAAAGLVLKW